MTPVKPNENHIGQKVWWRSSGTEKVGMIRGFIPARSELDYASIKTQGVSDRSIKFQPSSVVDRVLIEVPRTHKKTGESLPSFWYAPRLSQEFFLVD